MDRGAQQSPASKSDSSDHKKFGAATLAFIIVALIVCLAGIVATAVCSYAKLGKDFKYSTLQQLDDEDGADFPEDLMNPFEFEVRL